MKKIIYILFLFTLAFGVCDASAGERKKKKENKKKKELTAYQKLFDGKQVQTARGLMTLHKIGDKVYVEFPMNLLNKEMLFTSSVERISDSGESAVGEFSGPGVPLKFTRMDSVLQARLLLMNPLRNMTDDLGVNEAFNRSAMPGVYGSYKIEAWTPDSSAVVVDMTSLFMSHSVYTTPFTDYAGNSFFGFAVRDHKFQEDRNFLKGVKAYPTNVAVTCEMGYNVDIYFFGMFLMAKDMKVSIEANRILMLLPEEVMLPRLADYRVNVEYNRESGFESSMKGVKSVYFTNRWRMEPSDPEAYREGKTVEPKKPIVFYIDTLMPESIKPYVIAGVKEWNAAFEKIGFKNAIQVKDCPKDDPDFDMADVSHSTILYAPIKMYDVKSQKYCDPRTGEILSASILIPVGYVPTYELKMSMMSVNPQVRNNYIPVEVYGDVIKSDVAKQMGICLGFTDNFMASSVYPVDSLRSATFTQTHGLTPSVMDLVACNYIAQPGDMEKGVRMFSKGIGEFDYFTVKWLYQPIDGTVKPQDETEVLNRWIIDAKKELNYRYSPMIWSFYRLLGDPRRNWGDLGDDPMKSLEYRISNVKYAMKHFREWFKDDDKDLRIRTSLHSSFSSLISNEMNNLLGYVGGIYLNEVTADEDMPTFTVVPKERQQEIVRYVLDISKKFGWMDDKEYIKETGLGYATVPSQEIQLAIIGGLLGKVGDLKLCAEKSDDAYTPDEFLDDLYAYIWEGTLKKRVLTEDERFLQRSFVGMVMASSAVAESPASFEKEQQRFPFITSQNLVCWKPDTREFNRMEQKWRNNYLPSQRSGYHGYVATAKGYNAAPEYYSMLVRIQKLLQGAVLSSSGDTKAHYEYLLYRIRKAMSKK
ncbi:zinc-dependent metalloprotease [Gabonibacter chumensis]|uniref:zinc-dependent metalloprotease n=1 Tax=Gabonibacter chumensis TaxID=2972474 RepID=UPI002573E046|nr:zinc-dependent metalloprotease [Gabonibacter chumensis]MCR9012573.1 zinc-dependent metalloprotease [Gabonibacter chumensis]